MRHPERAAAVRRDLDALAEHHRLPEPAVEVLLELAAARPSPQEDLRLAARTLGLAGVLSLCAGVIFFVAANWDALGALARFALLHALLLACAAAALARPPPARAGRLALLGAFVLAGALLALFGQTYQTGADTYELFLAWAGLGLPLVVLTRWSVAWGAWVLVVDVALSLLCGWLPGAHVLWTVLAGMGVTGPTLFALAAGTNLALWGACEAATGTRLADLAPPWLARLLVAAAVAFGTWGSVYQIATWRNAAEDARGRWILAASLVVGAAAILWHAFRRRRDVFPIAAVAAGAIVVGAALVLRAAEGGGSAAGAFLGTAAWLVASSTASGWALMGWLRRWREEGTLS